MEYSSKIERVMNFMMMLCLNETVDQLAMVISVHWIDVLRNEDVHAMRIVMHFEIEGQMRKGRHVMT